MPYRYEKLNADAALIWRIVHRANVPWLLDNDVRCAASPIRSPHYVSIGNRDLIDKRRGRVVPIAPGGTLGDYVPFYFTPFSLMMFNIVTGRSGVVQHPNRDICILVFELRKLAQAGVPFVFTDRHAYLKTAQFFDDVADLSRIDWPLLQTRDFQRTDDDPGRTDRYQAEALIHGQAPVRLMSGLVCFEDSVRDVMQTEVDRRGLSVPVRTKPGWYF